MKNLIKSLTDDYQITKIKTSNGEFEISSYLFSDKDELKKCFFDKINEINENIANGTVLKQFVENYAKDGVNFTINKIQDINDKIKTIDDELNNDKDYLAANKYKFSIKELDKQVFSKKSLIEKLEKRRKDLQNKINSQSSEDELVYLISEDLKNTDDTIEKIKADISKLNSNISALKNSKIGVSDKVISLNKRKSFLKKEAYDFLEKETRKFMYSEYRGIFSTFSFEQNGLKHITSITKHQTLDEIVDALKKLLEIFESMKKIDYQVSYKQQGVDYLIIDNILPEQLLSVGIKFVQTRYEF